MLTVQFGIFDKGTGRLVRYGTLSAEDDEQVDLRLGAQTEGTGFVALRGEFSALDVIDTETFTPLGSRGAPPSAWHTWEGGWVVTASPARIASDLKTEVNREMELRDSVAIEYSGMRLDGDAKAKENLKGKIEEVRERLRLLGEEVPGAQPMPAELLIWRDADNVTHSWSSQEGYYNWLAGFAIALAERRTRMYAAAWQKKNQLDALAQAGDTEALLAFDLKANWP